MKKIEHQIFLKNNDIENLLIQPIKDKIAIFNRLYKLLETVNDCEKRQLLDELEKLDLEIMEDIDEQYGDKLSNNELEEIPVNVEEVKAKPRKNEPLSDEAVLNELYKMKQTKNIGRSLLRKSGLKSPLGWNTTIGKYRIVRISVFKYKYNIDLK